MSHRCYICYKSGLPESQFYHPACCKRVFGTVEAPEIPYSLDEMKELAKQIIVSRGAMTGVQPKISLGYDRTMKERKRLTVMTGEYILKPPSPKYPQMPENEDLTMHMAEELNIATVPHGLIPLATGELAYITKRQDRTPRKKIAMEDFHQLSGVDNKYRSSMERVGKLAQDFMTFPVLAKVTLLDITLFSFVTGNADMHLKNFSLIDRKSSGEYFLAPAYDLLNTKMLMPEDMEEMALPINGKKNRLKLEDFKNLATNYGLDEEQFQNAIDKLLATADKMEEWIGNSFLSDENKEAYTDLLLGRMEHLTK